MGYRRATNRDIPSAVRGCFEILVDHLIVVDFADIA